MTDEPGIDGALLHTIEVHYREAIGQENAITASEMADRIGMDDAEASPKTREAIKILMREAGLPLIGGNSGYYLPESKADVDEAIDSLDGRIAGIQERKQLIRDNWEQWTGRDQDNDDVDPSQSTVEARTDGGRRDVPDEVREQIENDPVLTIEDWVAHTRGDGDE